MFIAITVGEMESTLLHSYLKGARVRSWLRRPDCPVVFHQIKILFDRLYTRRSSAREEGRDEFSTRPASEEEREGVQMSASTPENLKPLVGNASKVYLRGRMIHGGITYATEKTHLGNSVVEYRTPSTPQISSFGMIQYIYSKDGSHFLFAIAQQLPLNISGEDPYAIYPHFHAQSYSTEKNPQLCCIEPSTILGHAARWVNGSECAVILSLSRVSDCLMSHLPCSQNS